jgi:predicted secreted hydrolase
MNAHLGYAWLVLAALTACTPQAQPPSAGASLARSLATDTAGQFEPITAPLQLSFPRDHGAHPQQRVEWWYLTSRVSAANGRRFGTQFALFRYALAPEDQAMRADWQSRQIYLAHSAITDIDGDRFVHDEQTSRAAAGLAGAQTQPFRVWLADCSAGAASSASLLPLQLRCGGGDFGYQLHLTGNDPPVLHGAAGYSAKSDWPGSASAYYSYPRLAARGELWIGDSHEKVSGAAWFDHEWTSGVLGGAQIGWDWFSLRLSDGSSLMVFAIRNRDGSIAAEHGSLIAADGSVSALDDAQIELRRNAYWTSPHSGARYPLYWTLSLSALDLSLRIAPLRQDQELSSGLSYWEGAIDAHGRRGNQPLRGEGYLELTGYEP